MDCATCGRPLGGKPSGDTLCTDCREAAEKAREEAEFWSDEITDVPYDDEIERFPTCWR